MIAVTCWMPMVQSNCANSHVHRLVQIFRLTTVLGHPETSAMRIEWMHRPTLNRLSMIKRRNDETVDDDHWEWQPCEKIAIGIYVTLFKFSAENLWSGWLAAISDLEELLIIELRGAHVPQLYLHLEAFSMSAISRLRAWCACNQRNLECAAGQFTFLEAQTLIRWDQTLPVYNFVKKIDLVPSREKRKAGIALGSTVV